MFRHENYPLAEVRILRRYPEWLRIIEANLKLAASTWNISTLAGEEVHESSSYCTKPTLGTGVGSGTSRMGPNCFS